MTGAQLEIPVPEGPSAFAADPAVVALAAPYLAHATPELRERWAAPLPVASRVALLRTLGAPEGVLRALLAAWAAWRAP